MPVPARLLPAARLPRRVARRLRYGRNRPALDRAIKQNAGLKKTVQEHKKSVEGLEAWRSARHADMSEEDRDLIRLVRPYSMTSWDKLHALLIATRHVGLHVPDGAFVECGVWRGGSVHAIARKLLSIGVTDRDIYLFDTFSGMTEPTDRDVDENGRTAAERLATSGKKARIWALASREDVEAGLATLDYPNERFHLVEGPVEETIPSQAPDSIAMLRLDTDWYESTRHELVHLYDRLVPDGILIIDDYGSWQGSREATDEFLAELESPPLMQRAGKARFGVKPR